MKIFFRNRATRATSLLVICSVGHNYVSAINDPNCEEPETRAQCMKTSANCVWKNEVCERECGYGKLDDERYALGCVRCSNHWRDTCEECPWISPDTKNKSWCVTGDCSWNSKEEECKDAKTQCVSGGKKEKISSCSKCCVVCEETDCGSDECELNGVEDEVKLCREKLTEPNARIASVYMKYNDPTAEDEADQQDFIPHNLISIVKLKSKSDTTSFKVVANDFGYAAIQQIDANTGAIIFSIFDSKHQCSSNTLEDRKKCKPESLAYTTLKGKGAESSIVTGETGASKLIIKKSDFPKLDVEYHFSWHSWASDDGKQVNHRLYYWENGLVEWELIGEHTVSTLKQNASPVDWWHHSSSCSIENWTQSKNDELREAHYGPTLLYHGAVKRYVTSGIFEYTKDFKENSRYVNAKMRKNSHNDNYLAVLKTGAGVERKFKFGTCTGKCEDGRRNLEEDNRDYLEEDSRDYIGYGSGDESGDESGDGTGDTIDPILEFEKRMLCLNEAGTTVGRKSRAEQKRAIKEIKRCLDKNFCPKKSKSTKSCKSGKVSKVDKRGRPDKD